MRNKFEIVGNKTLIYFNNTDKFAIVDTININKLKNYYFYIDNKGYARGYLNRKVGTNKIFLHHIIMGKPTVNKVIDHIDRNPLNNLISNLRIVNYSINSINRVANSNCKTGIRGVHFIESSNMYRARVKRNGKSIHLGMFKKLEDAKECVDKFNEIYLMNIKNTEPYNIEELLKGE